MLTWSRAAAVLAAGTFALAGCASDSGAGRAAQPEDGFSDKTAEEIKDAAVEAMQGLTSVTMKGELTSGGEALSIDLTMNTDGDCRGSIGAQGATAQIIALDGGVFLKGDERFWAVSTGSETQGKAMSKIIGDRWVDTGETGGFSEICDLDNLIASFEDQDGEAVEKGDTGDIDGQDAIGITGQDGDGNETVGWVSTAEDHYVLRFEQVGGDEPGRIDFSGFDDELAIEAPTGDDVVDFSELS